VLRTRVISAIILLPIVLLLAYLGGIPWLMAILVAGIIAWLEMTRLLQRDTLTYYPWLGFVFIPLLIAAAYVRSARLLPLSGILAGGADLPLFLLVTLIIVSLTQALFDRHDHPTTNWALTVSGIAYLGLLLSTFVTLRERPNGLWWVLLAFSLTWIIDAAAYFVGRSFGKHKWWPRLSPNKTWEGLIAGSVAGIIAAPLLGMWWLRLSPWWGLLLGVLAVIAAPLGDLAVSLFKRMANTKDSGNLIPGHGGILDRLDSLLFIFPVVTYFALLVAGP
jgi:phosphatidate cytidylyltransferase